MSDFISLYTAFSGLTAAQAGVNTTSHNIANAATPGFTRQRVDLASRRVSESEVVAINVTADVAFGFRAGTDVFTVLDNLEAALYADDTAGVKTALADVDSGLQTVLGGLGIIGARTNQIETAMARNADDVITITQQLSSLEDVDIAEAVMELQLQQTAYEVALASFAQSSQTSLVDFLR